MKLNNPKKIIVLYENGDSFTGNIEIGSKHWKDIINLLFGPSVAPKWKWKFRRNIWGTIKFSIQSILSL